MRSITCRFECVNIANYVDVAPYRSQLLSPAELDYFEKLPVLRRRMSYLMGRMAAKGALVQLIGDCDYRSISIEPGSFGQPVVRYGGQEPFEVSIAHDSGQAVAVAFEAGYPVGIDVETFNPTLYQTLIDAVPDSEKSWCDGTFDYYSQYSQYPQRLLALWTLKEALLKVLRCGMTVPMELLSIADLQCIFPNHYRASFRHFAQYQARLWIADQTVLSVVFPRQTEINFDPFQKSWFSQNALHPMVDSFDLAG